MYSDVHHRLPARLKCWVSLFLYYFFFLFESDETLLFVIVWTWNSVALMITDQVLFWIPKKYVYCPLIRLRNKSEIFPNHHRLYPWIYLLVIFCTRFFLVWEKNGRIFPFSTSVYYGFGSGKYGSPLYIPRPMHVG